MKKSNYDYCHCYCEENIYRLADRLLKEGIVDQKDESLKIVFISNPNKTIPVWKKNGSRVVWDYHVILFQTNKTTSETKVFDFDSDLDFPISLDEYARICLRSKDKIQPHYSHYFRVVDHAQLVQTFSSDRSHMKTANGWK